MEQNTETDQDWKLLLEKLTNLLGKTPSMEGILFIIGVEELGKGKKVFSKEEKQDLMHIGVCSVLANAGYYELERRDNDGWPHFKLLQPLPALDLEKQEQFLKTHIKTYFKDL